MNPEIKLYLEVELLKTILGGADILDMTQARQLRRLKETSPELLIITSAQGDYSVNEPHPYFGAIATRLGHKVVEQYEAERNQ